MEAPSYMRSIVDRNVVKWRVGVWGKWWGENCWVRDKYV